MSSSLKYSRTLRAAGLGGAALAASEAAAAVVHVPVDIFLPSFGHFLSFEGATPNFSEGYDNSGASDAFVRPCGLNLGVFDSDFQWAGSGSTPLFFNPSDTIDANLPYSAAPNLFGDLPEAGEVVYVGYRLQNQGGAGDETFYGYMQITGEGSSNFSFTVDSYTYEDVPGTGITVIPEPSVTALFLGGAALTVIGWRRLRRS